MSSSDASVLSPRTAVFAVVVLATFAVGGGSHAAQVPEVPQCPASYSVDGVKLTKVPEAWIGEVVGPLRLQAVTIAVGDPTRENEIIPDKSTKVRGGGVVTRYAELEAFGKKRWLVCNYGYGGVVRLYQRLGPNIGQCEVKYRPYPGPSKLEFDSYRCE